MFTITRPSSQSYFNSPSSPLAARSINTTPTRLAISKSKLNTMPYAPESSPSTFGTSNNTMSSPLVPSRNFTPMFTPDLAQLAQTPHSHIKRHVDPRRVLSQNSEQKRGQRRDTFMKKVQGQRDEQRWEARGDQILYHDYLSQRKAWEQQQAQAAPDFEPEMALDDNEQGLPQNVFSRAPAQYPYHSAQSDTPLSKFEEDEIDELLDAEAQELEALIAMHEEPPTASQENKYCTTNWPVTTLQQSSPFLGPDDADFDELLVDLPLEEDVMDMS